MNKGCFWRILGVLIVLLMAVGFTFSAGPVMLAGQVLGIQPGTAAYIISNACAGKCGFEVWQNATQTLQVYLGPVSGGYGWVIVDPTNGSTGIAADILDFGGQMSKPESLRQLMDGLKSNGWRQIPVKEFGTGIAATVDTALAFMGAKMAGLFRRKKYYDYEK